MQICSFAWLNWWNTKGSPSQVIMMYPGCSTQAWDLLQAMLRIRSRAQLFSHGVFAPKWLILPEICLYCLSANLWWPYLQYLLCNSLIQKVLKSMQGFSLLLTVLCNARIWTLMGSFNYSLHLPALKMWSWPPSMKKASLVPTAGFF